MYDVDGLLTAPPPKEVGGLKPPNFGEAKPKGDVVVLRGPGRPYIRVPAELAATAAKPAATAVAVEVWVVVVMSRLCPVGAAGKDLLTRRRRQMARFLRWLSTQHQK